MVEPCLKCDELETELRRLRNDTSQPPNCEQRRIQRLDTLGQLAAAITHEYNNTLAVILQSAVFLLEDGPLEGEQRADVEHIRRAAERARSFTQLLATFGRARSLRHEPIDCNLVIQHLQARIQAQCASQRIELACALSGAGSVLADRGQLEMMLLALIGNAREAMPSGGLLTIATRRAIEEGKPFFHIEVADSGEGFAPEILDQIFDPFFTTRPRAMGLGLSAVYAIAHASGGHVRAENRQGAHVTVSLPVV